MFILIKEVLLSMFSGIGLLIFKDKTVSNKEKTNITVNVQSFNKLENKEYAIVKKTLNIFESHGIHINEIPRIVPFEFGINLSILNCEEKLVEKITPEFINWLCSFFGIRREYLEKDENRIYATHDYYKNEGNFLSLIANLKKQGNDFEIYVFKNVKELNRNNKEQYSQKINIAIRVKIFQDNNLVVYKTIPTSTMWYWNYWRCRYQFKAIIRTLYEQGGIYFKGYDISTDDVVSFASGKLFFSELKIATTFSWHPEDYALSPEESSVAKESDESDEIKKYIMDFPFDYKLNEK